MHFFPWAHFSLMEIFKAVDTESSAISTPAFISAILIIPLSL